MTPHQELDELLGLPPLLIDTLDLTPADTWPPTPGARHSPDSSDTTRIWARVDLAEWLHHVPNAFGPHRADELATLAHVGHQLRYAGEGTHVLWALDIIAPRYWIDHPHTALAVTELVCLGPEFDDRLLSTTDAALSAISWTPTPGTEANDTCTVHHTLCHYNAWTDGISAPQHLPNRYSHNI